MAAAAQTQTRQTQTEVILVPVLEDNYAYLIVDGDAGVAAAVDPVEPQKVLDAAAARGVRVSHVLTTHSHWDHSGGNEEFVRLAADEALVVVGGANDGIPAATAQAREGDEFQVGSVTVRCLDTPCHTPGHMCYVAGDAVFTGDTLFIAGCGRFNSGSPAQMHEALNVKLAALPPATRVFCGHEYTVNNLRFAAAVEPDNAAVAAKAQWARERREAGEPTVPSTIADELATNPFMRTGEAAVASYAALGEGAGQVEVIAALREAKNSFGLGAGAL